MDRLFEWLQRLWATMRPARPDEDLAEELRSHLELASERGRRETGAAQAMEALRDQRGLPWLENLARDLHYGVRLLARSPVFAAAAILSLALGIGANAAIFELIDAVRLRYLRVHNPDELVELRHDGPAAFGIYDSINARATYPLWKQIRAHQRAFSAVAAWGDTQLVVDRGAAARQARGLWISGEFFSVLGLAAERGRLITVADDRRGCGAGVVVISHGFWQTRYAGAEPIVGKTLTILDHVFTIVGVTPPAFTGMEIGQTFDVAMPLCSKELWGPSFDARDRWWLAVIGRLKPGWTIAQANDHLRTLSSGLLEATVLEGYGKELSDAYRKLTFSAIPAGRGVSRLRDSYGTPLSVLLGLTGLLLLITCGNLATLLLARASAREREIAVRAALGASRRRLVSQMLIESLLLAGIGAAVAVPVAVFSARALVAFLDTPLNPITLTLTADWRLIAFIASIAALTTLVFGCVPALRISFVGAGAAMRQMSRGVTLDRQRTRFQRALVAIQVAVSLILVVSALMFVQSFRKLATVDVGFDADDTIAVVFMDFASQGLPAEQKIVFQEELTEAIRLVPGVSAAASSSHVPLRGGNWSHFFRVSGAPNDERKASRFAYVSPAYFQTLKIPRTAGRDFTDADTARSRPVMLVNESFVQSHLQGLNPVGTTIRRLAEPEFPETIYEIVGVVGNTKYGDLRDENCWCGQGDVPMPPIAYIPIAQNPAPYAWSPVIVRSAAQAPGVTTAIADRVKQLNAGIGVGFVGLKSQIRQRLAGERLMAWLAGAFGLLALLLITVGLHGLIAYLAVSRTNEIGIRLSLGSTRVQIVRLVLRDSVWMIGAGVLMGVAVMRGADAVVGGLSPAVPTVVGAVIMLAAVAALAGAIPAWRAARLDPNAVLRAD